MLRKVRQRRLAALLVIVLGSFTLGLVIADAIGFVSTPRISSSMLRTPTPVSVPSAMKLGHIGELPLEVSHSPLVTAWGVFGVAAYLAYGVQKVGPIIRIGISSISSSSQWVALVLTLIFFAYVEGFRGFQKSFAPRVVSRAWAVSQRGGPLWHKIAAPIFSIGYFHGRRGRVLSSWLLTLGVAGVVAGVKRLGPVSRGIVDAGVALGLTWGIASVILIYLRSLLKGSAPEYDPALPRATPYVVGGASPVQQSCS